MLGLEHQTCAKIEGNPSWEAYMREEYNSLMENKTWESVPLPPDRFSIPDMELSFFLGLEIS